MFSYAFAKLVVYHAAPYGIQYSATYAITMCLSLHLSQSCTERVYYSRLVIATLRYVFDYQLRLALLSVASMLCVSGEH